MNNKALIAIIVAVVVVCAGIGAAILISNMNNDDSVKEGVIYHGNGGKSDTGSSTVNSTSHEVKGITVFTKDGYTFASWNTKADGSGSIFRPGDSVEFGTGEIVDLYAIWSTYSLEFNRHGAYNLLGIYYDKIKIDPEYSIGIPDSGPINVILKPVDGATDLHAEKYTEDDGTIVLAVSFTKTNDYTYVTSISIDNKSIDFDYEEVDGIYVLTFNYSKSDVLIGYVERWSEEL